MLFNMYQLKPFDQNKLNSTLGLIVKEPIAEKEHTKFCPQCKAEIDSEAEKCPNWGLNSIRCDFPKVLNWFEIDLQ